MGWAQKPIARGASLVADEFEFSQVYGAAGVAAAARLHRGDVEIQKSFDANSVSTTTHQPSPHARSPPTSIYEEDDGDHLGGDASSIRYIDPHVFAEGGGSPTPDTSPTELCRQTCEHAQTDPTITTESEKPRVVPDQAKPETPGRMTRPSPHLPQHSA